MVGSSNSKTPKAAYTQIEGRLRNKIRQGDWPAGAMLPSRRDLAKEYGVSSLTIARAVTRLIAEGLLRADDRRGTFVTNQGANTTPLLQIEEVGETREDVVFYSPVEKTRPLQTGVVGIVASLYDFDSPNHLELNNFWVRLLLQSLENVFSEDGRTSLFFNRIVTPGESPASIEEGITSLLNNGVDAIVVITLGTDPNEVDNGLEMLDGRDIPVVCITTSEIRRPVPHLFYDNRSAGYQAAVHLIRRGCDDILFLSPFGAAWVTERLNGIKSALEHARLPQSILRVFPSQANPWIPEEDPEALGYQVGMAALDAGIIQSSVIGANDGVTLGFLKAASEQGKIPGMDFAVVSFDDHPAARTIGLTTLRPPMEMIGKEAARLLLRALQGERTDLQMRFRSHLIARSSTRAAHPRVDVPVTE